MVPDTQIEDFNTAFFALGPALTHLFEEVGSKSNCAGGEILAANRRVDSVDDDEEDEDDYDEDEDGEEDEYEDDEEEDEDDEEEDEEDEYDDDDEDEDDKINLI